MRLPAARAIPIPTTTASLQLAGGLTLVVGWGFWETTNAAPAVFKLWSGTANTGTLLAPISLSTGQSTRDLIPAPFLEAPGGVFLEMVGGSIQGSLWALEATLIGGYAFADGAIPWPAFDGG